MDPLLQQRLLASIQENRLIVFSGAGLSRSAPSTVPGAVDLSKDCAAEYQRRALPLPLPPGSDANLEVLTDFFVANRLQGYFVNELVQWRPFRRNPNKGHLAAADLLTCGALHSTVTTNFDDLIELSAMELGEDDFHAALDLPAANLTRAHRPLVKIHGCVRDKIHTLWCPRQLNPPPPPLAPPEQEIQRRVSSCKTWLSANIAGRDIIFVGFWSDWAYLTPILASALTGLRASLVVLVDPGDAAYLSAKAPDLWTWANTATTFEHVPQSGDEFLDELRSVFAINFMQRTLTQAMPSFNALHPGSPAPHVGFAGASNEDLYALRRDTAGVPGSRIPRMSTPDPSTGGVGRVHLRLRHSGAALSGRFYQLADGRKIRVVNGRTQVLSRVKAEFLAEPVSPPGLSEDIVICAGAYDDAGAATHVMRPSVAPTVLRSGISAEWMTENAAEAQHLI